MLIKRKSLIVAVISSIVVSLVLVLTLVGYLIYIELRGREFKRTYDGLFEKVSARAYSRYYP